MRMLAPHHGKRAEREKSEHQVKISKFVNTLLRSGGMSCFGLLRARAVLSLFLCLMVLGGFFWSGRFVFNLPNSVGKSGR